MPLRLYNTLSGKIEEFRPLADNQVRMYACGPTVYDYGHIGNFRTFIAVDGLRRFLRQSGYQVRHVMNITDVDDKIIQNAVALHQPVEEYTAKYTEAFREDCQGSLDNQGREYLERITRAAREMGELLEALLRFSRWVVRMNGE